MGRRPDAADPLQTYFDSHSAGPGIHKWLHYFHIYHRHLNRFVGRDISVLEIGVESGGSLGMWSHYFGPKCRMFGVDINPKCKSFENGTTKIYIGDQGDRKFWRQFTSEVPALDIVIDDWSHDPDHQLLTFEELLPHIRPGGIYICEDIHGAGNRFSAYIHSVADQLNAMNTVTSHTVQNETIAVQATPFQSIVSSISYYPFVTIVELAERPTSRFTAERHGDQWIASQ